MPHYEFDVNTPNEESLDDDEVIVNSLYKGDLHIVDTVHEDQDVYECEYEGCNETFENPQEYGGHVSSQHT